MMPGPEVWKVGLHTLDANTMSSRFFDLNQLPIYLSVRPWVSAFVGTGYLYMYAVGLELEQAAIQVARDVMPTFQLYP